jgi:flagellar protein FliS
MEVQTTPGKLIVMLYDGALRFLEVGLDALHRGDLATRGLYLGKAQNILCELTRSLDLEVGEIATGLHQIYGYCLERLLVGHAEDRAEPIEEVIRLLRSLRESWDHAERALRSGESAAAPVLAGAAR